MRKKIDIKGQRFGRLVAVSEAGKDKWNAFLWLCRCDCGAEKIVLGNSLRRNEIRSCGCLQKERISKRNKENKYFLGKKHSPETRQKMSDALKGKKHPNYNANLTDKDRFKGRRYPEYRGWRTAIFERDNYTCQNCGDNKGGNLVAHHKESYNSNPDLRIEVTNGITLCEECHLNFHHQFGYGNNTKKQLYYFMLEGTNKWPE